MITLTASAEFGHTGQYVARITGRDSKFTFAREFVGSKGGKRNEITTADIDEPGLYECRDVTRKGRNDRYRLIVRRGDTLERLASDKADAMQIARALDEGRTIDQVVRLVEAEGGGWAYEILSAAEAKRADVAQTIESATAACWEILQALPEVQAKKVLTALRAKVSPTKTDSASASETGSEVQP